MKIISTPDYSSWLQKLSCDYCSTKIEIVIEDVLYKTDKRWYSDPHDIGGYYADVDFFFVKCPTCGKDINVHTGDIPMFIQSKLKKI